MEVLYYKEGEEIDPDTEIFIGDTIEIDLTVDDNYQFIEWGGSGFTIENKNSTPTFITVESLDLLITPKVGKVKKVYTENIDSGVASFEITKNGILQSGSNESIAETGDVIEVELITNEGVHFLGSMVALYLDDNEPFWLGGDESPLQLEIIEEKKVRFIMPEFSPLIALQAQEESKLFNFDKFQISLISGEETIDSFTYYQDDVSLEPISDQHFRWQSDEIDIGNKAFDYTLKFKMPSQGVNITSVHGEFDAEESVKQLTQGGVRFPDLIFIDAQTFSMAYPFSNKMENDEVRHFGYINNSFHISESPITQKQFTTVMGYNPSENIGDDNPVENVTWQDVTKFCNKLTLEQKRAGLIPSNYGYAIPTETEWEKAANSNLIKNLNIVNDSTLETLKNEYYTVDSGVSQVAAGKNFLLYIKGSTLRGAGSNLHGQLGLSKSRVPVDTSIPIPSINGVEKAYAGKYHSLVKKVDGTIHFAGRNKEGQAGNGGTDDVFTFQQVKYENGTAVTDVVDASCGDTHTVFLLDDGSVWGMGLMYYPGHGSSKHMALYPTLIADSSTVIEGYEFYQGEITSVSAGSDFTLFTIKKQIEDEDWYSVAGIGDESLGSIGSGRAQGSTNSLKISLVTSFLTDEGLTFADKGINATSIQAGKYGLHRKSLISFVIDQDSKSWGTQDADGFFTQYTSEDISVKQIESRRDRVGVLNTDGDYFEITSKPLLTLGDYGEAGEDEDLNILFTNVDSFALGDQSTYILKDNGTLISFGYNYNGQLGNGQSLYDYNIFTNEETATKTTPVKYRKPGKIGLYDMSGNVWEWTLDFYEPYSVKNPEETHISNPASGQRVIRGGSFKDPDKELRHTRRKGFGITKCEKSDDLGFRICLRRWTEEEQASFLWSDYDNLCE
jgi:formylglycine-generating enzyme required for sulfatase activity